MTLKMRIGLPLLAALAVALLSAPAFAHGRRHRGHETPAGCNGYGCWAPGGGCNGYGCWSNGGGCNGFGCWNSPSGNCNGFGCSDRGSCNGFGCP